MRNYAEQKLHEAVAAYLGWCLPKPTLWTTIPAGGGGEERGRRLKRAGYRAGWPDIQIVHEGSLYALELKTGSGALSEAQKRVHAEIVAAGACVAVVRSIDDVSRQCREWGLPLRDKPASPVDALARSLARLALDAGD